MAQPQQTSAATTDRGDAIVPQRRLAEDVSPQGANPQSLDTDSQSLIRELSELAQTATDASEFYRQLFALTTSHADCLAMWHVNFPADGSPLQARSISDENANLLWEVIQDQIIGAITPAKETGNIVGMLTQPKPDHAIVAAPAHPRSANGTATEVLVAYFGVANSSLLRLQWLMGMLSQTVCQWQQRMTSEQNATQLRGLNDALQIINEVSQSTDQRQAAIVIANRLRQLFNVAHVAIATVNDGATQTPLAVSDVEQFDARSETGKLLVNAISQPAFCSANVVWPPIDDSQPSAHTLPLEQYAKAVDAASVASIALRNDTGNDTNQIVGVMLVASDSAAISDQQVAYIESISTLVWRQFEVVARANRSVGEVIRKSIQPKKWSRTAIWGVALFALAMAVPFPYRVKCDCRVQPTARRFVAAPYSGILESAIVRVGDVVKQDQIIARMDGRQLRIELAGLSAEFEGARRKSDSARAIREIAQSQIARSEMQRLESQIKLTRNRMQDLEIRSPINGIIVSGDLEKAQGAPLETGQTLFEVAPLERMVAEIGVPESEIQYVDQSQSVVIKLNAFPFQSWEGTVKSIHPSTEVINDQTVFVTEVELENPDGQLKPGMEGNAKISTQWSPLGWNLFHRAWEGLRCWTVW